MNSVDDIAHQAINTQEKIAELLRNSDPTGNNLDGRDQTYGSSFITGGVAGMSGLVFKMVHDLTKLDE